MVYWVQILVGRMCAHALHALSGTEFDFDSIVVGSISRAMFCLCSRIARSGQHAYYGQETAPPRQPEPKIARQQKPWSEEGMEKALELISLGKLSVRQAAEAYNISQGIMIMHHYIFCTCTCMQV